MPDSLGLYIHIPFCRKKCLYCDFYSAFISDKAYSNYFNALLREIGAWGKKINRPVDTVYIGGGTPSLLCDDIKPLMSAIRESFTLLPDAEITAECNPDLDEGFLKAAKSAGVNRLSFGVQAGKDDRLKLLGRGHTVKIARRAVNAARQEGFNNISCDIMIALPESDLKTLIEDVEFVCSLSPEHISVYILKIEKNTAFHKMEQSLGLPDDENTASQYLSVCKMLKDKGYEHYEISNFAKQGFKSRHNLKYWRCEEYLGIGPSAHSFISGERFYYPKDIKAFIKGVEPVSDGVGGETHERLMLAMRLKEGVSLDCFTHDTIKKVQKLKETGLVKISGGKISLTDRGMLVSNSIITELIYEDI